MTGMVVFDYAARCGEGAGELAGWLASGALEPREDVVEAVDNFPEALAMPFTGADMGKLVRKVADQ